MVSRENGAEDPDEGPEFPFSRDYDIVDIPEAW